MAQQNLQFVDTDELNGAIEKNNKPELNSINWFSETFQQETEKYLSKNFGFANWFIKFGNQIQYTFYNKANARDVIIGKENYLFEKSYIDTYYGTDFLGERAIQELYSKLRTVNDTLEKLNKNILIVFAPGKASFYPEYIPDYLNSKKKITNLEYCIKTADSLGLDYIDMSSWFIKMKDTVTYPIYAKTGIHWSHYGVKLATDSIVSYCTNKFALKLTDFTWSQIEMSSNLISPDEDIEKGMNLIFKIPNFPMAYTRMKFPNTNKNSARSIVIADSFYWQMHTMGFSTKLFNGGQFWFYNKHVHPKRNGKKTNVKDLNLREEILNQDVIILLTTEPVLKRRYWGFVDMAYDAIFNPINREDYNKQIETIISKIKNSQKWMESIEKKASIKNISVDSMLIIEAKYIYNRTQVNI